MLSPSLPKDVQNWYQSTRPQAVAQHIHDSLFQQHFLSVHVILPLRSFPKHQIFHATPYVKIA